MMGYTPLEISHGVLALQSGRLLAPGATLESQDKLGRLVIAAVSDDGGQTWPSHTTVFEDPDGVHGYFEQKLAEVEPGLLISTCWTVVMDGVTDIDDHFVISRDDGLTWSRPKPTGIMGQTMTPVPLGGDRLLVMYNRRYGQQGIVMNLVTFTDDAWTIHYEGMMYDPNTTADRPTDIDSGVDTFAAFQFGFPTAIRLPDGTYLATHWSQEGGKFGIRWTLLRIDW